jgi:hypothetical protein
MSSPHIRNSHSRHLPKVVAVAVALWVLSIFLRAVPLHVLLVAAPISGASWYFVPYYQGWSLVLPMQAALGVFLLLGHAWSRYAVAIFVAGLLLLQVNGNLVPQFGNFRLGELRNALIAVLEIATVALLFLPAAHSWFRWRG